MRTFLHNRSLAELISSSNMFLPLFGITATDVSLCAFVSDTVCLDADYAAMPYNDAALTGESLWLPYQAGVEPIMYKWYARVYPFLSICVDSLLRYSLGEHFLYTRNRRLKVEMLEKPTCIAISVIGSSACGSSSSVALMRL